MSPRLTITVGLLSLVPFLPAQESLACLFPVAPGARPAVLAQRAVLLRGDGQTQLLIQTSCPPEGAGGCWVVPVPGRVLAAAPSATELFSLLDAHCAPHWIDDPGATAGGCGGFAEAEPVVGGGLSPWDERPAELDVHALAGAQAVQQWLAEQGCLAPDSVPAELQRLEQAGWEFVAAFVPALPGAKGPAPRPVGPDQGLLVSYAADEAGLSTALLRGLPDQELDLLLYAVAGHRQAVRGHPTVDVDAPAWLAGDAFEQLYDRLLRQRLAAAGPGALASEFAGPLESGTALQQALAALAAPGGAVPPGGYLTRLQALLPAAELGDELMLDRHATDDPVRVRIFLSAGLLRVGGGGAGRLPAPPSTARALPATLLLLLLALLPVLLRLPWPWQARGPAAGSCWRGAAPVLAALALGLAATLPAGGCLPVGRLRSAQILEPGELEAMAGLFPARDPRHDLSHQPPVPGTSTSPRAALPALGLAYGLGHAMDASLLVSPIGGRTELRRTLLHEPAHPVSLAAGVALGGMYDFLEEERCQPMASSTGAHPDGCFEERRWGALVELPLTVSQQLGSFGWYAGLELGWLWLGSELRYADPQSVFPAVGLSKQVRRWTTGIFGGIEIQATEQLTVAGELQVLSSLNEARRMVYYLVPGVAVKMKLGE